MTSGKLRFFSHFKNRCASDTCCIIELNLTEIAKREVLHPGSYIEPLSNVNCPSEGHCSGYSGVCLQSCDSEGKQEDQKFRASAGYIVSLMLSCPNKTKTRITFLKLLSVFLS